MTRWDAPEDDTDLVWMEPGGYAHTRFLCPCGVYFVFRRTEDGTIVHDIIHRALGSLND